MRELDQACFTRAIGRDEYRRRRRVLLDTWTDPISASDIDSAHDASLDALVEAHTHGRDTVRRAVPHAMPLTALKHASRSSHFGARPLAVWAAVAAVAFAAALAYWLM
jgi:hypothetical protein